MTSLVDSSSVAMSSAVLDIGTGKGCLLFPSNGGLQPVPMPGEAWCDLQYLCPDALLQRITEVEEQAHEVVKQNGESTAKIQVIFTGEGRGKITPVEKGTFQIVDVSAEKEATYELSSILLALEKEGVDPPLCVFSLGAGSQQIWFTGTSPCSLQEPCLGYLICLSCFLPDA